MTNRLKLAFASVVLLGSLIPTNADASSNHTIKFQLDATPPAGTSYCIEWSNSYRRIEGGTNLAINGTTTCLTAAGSQTKIVTSFFGADEPRHWEFRVRRSVAAKPGKPATPTSPAVPPQQASTSYAVAHRPKNGANFTTATTIDVGDLAELF